MRVDGRRVRGVKPFNAPDGSASHELDCQDRVAEGVFAIGRDGRSFTYRSTWRDCGGGLLVTESSEGTISANDGNLTLLIEGSNGTATFTGAYTDSTLTIRELGGGLEFARRKVD